jgi:hypothetical protein
MQTILVMRADGDHWLTGFNSTEGEARAYFLGYRGEKWDMRQQREVPGSPVVAVAAMPKTKAGCLAAFLRCFQAVANPPTFARSVCPRPAVAHRDHAADGITWAGWCKRDRSNLRARALALAERLAKRTELPG